MSTLHISTGHWKLGAVFVTLLTEAIKKGK